MFEIVTAKEIQGIKERLEQEKKARHVLPGRYDELKTLINFLSTWLDWQKYRRKEYHRKEENQLEDILKRIEAGKEDCYNCENLTKFSRKELRESITEWKRARAFGLFKNLADTNPYIARCKIQGPMTELGILRLHNNCKEKTLKLQKPDNFFRKA